jgi:hypothetical protein
MRQRFFKDVLAFRPEDLGRGASHKGARLEMLPDAFDDVTSYQNS